MFTGIVTDVARIVSLQKNLAEDLLVTLELEKHSNLSELKIGCSVACNGVCLTLIRQHQKSSKLLLDFQVSSETINKTNIKNWTIDAKINIEFALKIGDEIGGHLVSGHVDDVARIEDIEILDQSRIFTFTFKPELRKFIAPKGSVTLNGVSLTVNQVFADKFQVNIIDHTFYHTNFNFLKIGDEVNLEIDQIARYLSNLQLYA